MRIWPPRRAKTASERGENDEMIHIDAEKQFSMRDLIKVVTEEIANYTRCDDGSEPDTTWETCDVLLKKIDGYDGTVHDCRMKEDGEDCACREGGGVRCCVQQAGKGLLHCHGECLDCAEPCADVMRVMRARGLV